MKKKEPQKTFLIRFFGSVTDVRVGEFFEKMDEMRSKFKDFIVQVFINTNGGDMNQGFAVYDYLRRYPAYVMTIAEGLVASAGVIMFLGGGYRLVTPHSSLMVHVPKMYPNEHEAVSSQGSLFTGERLAHLECMFQDIVCRRTKLDRPTISQQMRDEKFFYAREAIKCGLAHRMLGSVR